jgi:hypothetical protein
LIQRSAGLARGQFHNSGQQLIGRNRQDDSLAFEVVLFEHIAEFGRVSAVKGTAGVVPHD